MTATFQQIVKLQERLFACVSPQEEEGVKSEMTSLGLLSEPKAMPSMKTLGVNMYAAPGGAGRALEDVGKAHLEVKLLFDTFDDAIAWLRQNGISTAELRLDQAEL